MIRGLNFLRTSLLLVLMLIWFHINGFCQDKSQLQVKFLMGIFNEVDPALPDNSLLTPNHGFTGGLFLSYTLKSKWFGRFGIQLDRTIENDINESMNFYSNHFSIGRAFTFKAFNFSPFLGVSSVHRPNLFISGEMDANGQNVVVEQSFSNRGLNLFSDWGWLNFGMDFSVPLTPTSDVGLGVMGLIGEVIRMDFNIFYKFVLGDRKKNHKK